MIAALSSDVVAALLVMSLTAARLMAIAPAAGAAMPSSVETERETVPFMSATGV